MKKQSMIFKLLSMILIGPIFLSFTISAQAEEDKKLVVATGVAAIKGENKSGARQEAIQDALKQSLEQGVGMVMNATTILKNDELMERIYANTQGYITGYAIIKEVERAGLCRVTIEADVKTGALRETLAQLGIIKAMMDYPRVLILSYPQEQITPSAQTAETILVRNFTGRLFDVVDPTKSRELHQNINEILKTDTLENAAARIGLQHYAEVVIFYSLNTAGSEFDGIMEQTPVTIRTKAIVSTTAQILSAEEKTVNGLGKTIGLARQHGAGRAAESVSETLMTRITSWWWDHIANGLPYIVTLNSPAKADRMIIRFQEAVESIPGVVSLTERSSGGGITEMMVKYKGSSAQFKREILSSLNTQIGFSNLHSVASKGRFLVFSLR